MRPLTLAPALLAPAPCRLSTGEEASRLSRRMGAREEAVRANDREGVADVLPPRLETAIRRSPGPPARMLPKARRRTARGTGSPRPGLPAADGR